MKSIFIVSSYPSNEKKIKVLKETLRSLRGIGYDILLTTNLPIKDQEIYDLIDYHVYDKTDIQDFFEYGAISESYGWYARGQNFECTTSFNNAYHFDLYRSIYNGVSLAQRLGYEYFNYIEGDCIILNPSMVTNVRDRLIETNKKLFFVQCDINDDRFSYKSFGTHFFGGLSKYFIEENTIPHDVEGWISDPLYYCNGMEVIFYRKFIDVIDDILVLPLHSENDIVINKIKKIDEYGLKYAFFYDDIDFHLFFINASEKDVMINVYLDDTLHRNYILRHNHYNIEKINIDNYKDKKIKIERNIDGETDIYEKVMTDSYIDILKKTQKIKYF